MIAALAALTLVIAAVVAWRTSLVLRKENYFFPWWTYHRRARRAAEIGCDQGRWCEPDKHHGPCRVCGKPACWRTGYIEASTKRRRMGFTCRRHGLSLDAQQEALRTERRRADWEKLTDPIDASRLAFGQLPEQYRGPLRSTLRAFVESGADTAVCSDLNAADLNASIHALGITDVYAEQRANETVLRRTNGSSKARAR